MSNGGWEKILWKRQHFPDNYVPPKAFLSSLQRNTNFRPYTYWPLVLATCAITQHLAGTFLFVGVFVSLKERTLDPRVLVWVSVGCFMVGYVIWECLEVNMDRAVYRDTRVKALKSSLLIFLALMSLSPVLKTLTAATSSDSIWALSAFLFFLNALLADYSAPLPGVQRHERLTSVLSMNAAISSSVVLASRLPTDLAVFALILFSVQTFALFPKLRYRLQATPIPVRVLLTLALSALAVWMSRSNTAWRIYVTILFSVTFLAPAFLVWAQQYKNEIRGPWDVAVPKVN